MDALGQLLTGGLLASTPNPMDDFWYGPVGQVTSSGIRIDSEGAKKISAWFRGRDILATSLAMLPLHLYQRLADDAGAEKARNHALYDALHRKPNASNDDSFIWRRQHMFDLIDTGHAYDWIGVGTAWTLDPINPALVTPERIKKGPYKGKTLFHVRDEETGRSTTHTEDEIFHLCASDGKGILESARESLGTARSTEGYASTIYSKGTLNGGVIEHPGVLNDEAARRMAKSFVTRPGEWHFPKVLEQGSKWVQNTLTPENAQMLLSRKFSINDIARWLGLPPHMLGDLDRATFSNIEQQGQEFVTYSLGPWLALWEFAINVQLILQPNRFYAEFTRDALVRGEIATRWAAHVAAVNAGIKSVDEVRAVENLNKRGGKADELREPANITGGRREGEQPTQIPKPRPSDQNARVMAIVQQSAARLLRKEIAAVQKMAVRHAADADAFAMAVSEFYAGHAALVAETLQWGQAEADGYCAGQASQVVSGNWIAAIEQWGAEAYAAGLAAMALEEAA